MLDITLGRLIFLLALVTRSITKDDHYVQLVDNASDSDIDM